MSFSYHSSCRRHVELIAYWVILHVFCRLLIFFKINLLKKFFQENHQNVKQNVAHISTFGGKSQHNSNVFVLTLKPPHT